MATKKLEGLLKKLQDWEDQEGNEIEANASPLSDEEAEEVAGGSNGICFNRGCRDKPDEE